MPVHTLWKSMSEFLREFSAIMDHARTGRPSPHRGAGNRPPAAGRR
ncbi:hypothetical protein [Nitratireductor thuwali]|uniref:Uncharacterized protein n=1 Tax=Nitratireductor thuwali TaxID=2267699 RepID=A0ABY5MDA3_9HYPH|nr:hypothetical protein NTH_00483 [Nitratireductor thuwali]